MDRLCQRDFRPRRHLGENHGWQQLEASATDFLEALHVGHSLPTLRIGVQQAGELLNRNPHVRDFWSVNRGGRRRPSWRNSCRRKDLSLRAMLNPGRILEHEALFVVKKSSPRQPALASGYRTGRVANCCAWSSMSSPTS